MGTNKSVQRLLCWIVGWSTLLIACGPVNQQCYYHNVENYTNEQFKLTYLTVSGLHVQDPNNELNPALLDSTTQNVISCLQRQLPKMTPQDMATSWCYGVPSPQLELRSCLKIAVPKWKYSACTNEQVFPCNVPFSGCAEKGFAPDGGCPCSCRSTVQGNDMILTTPNLRIYPQSLTILLTNCFYPYGTPIEECVSSNQIK